MTKEFTPHPYQTDMIQHALINPRCALWAGMGMGKTSATLEILNIIALTDDRPVLIIAPKRVAKFTWPQEIAKWSNFVNRWHASPILGDVAARTRALANKNANLFTTNYENLPWLIEALGDKWPFATVIADEATKLKGFRVSQGGMRARALGKIAHNKITNFIELTGTPSPNGLKDLWGQLWFLDAGRRLGRSFSAFEQRWFFTGQDGWSINPMPFAHEQIETAVGDLCLSVRPEDWFDVAKPIESNIEINLPDKARAAYRAMEKELFAEVDTHGVEALSAAAKYSKCLQIASGAVYHDDEKNWVEVHDAKIAAVESIIEEAGGAPVLVAYNFACDLVRLKKTFGATALDLAVDADLARALRGEGKVWLAHPASVGHGIDGLQKHCREVVFFTVGDNLEHYQQIIERIGPMRQKQAGLNRAVFVRHILANDTLDTLALERQRTKRRVQDLLMHATKRSAP